MIPNTTDNCCWWSSGTVWFFWFTSAFCIRSLDHCLFHFTFLNFQFFPQSHFLFIFFSQIWECFRSRSSSFLFWRCKNHRFQPAVFILFHQMFLVKRFETFLLFQFPYLFLILSCVFLPCAWSWNHKSSIVSCRPWCT